MLIVCSCTQRQSLFWNLVSVPNSSEGLIFVKRLVLFFGKNTDKIQILPLFCCFQLHLVQSVLNIFGWNIGVNETSGHSYHSMSDQDHHLGFVIEHPKQLRKGSTQKKLRDYLGIFPKRRPGSCYCKLLMFVIAST